MIEKLPVVTEELLVSKRNIQEIKHFSDTVQREEARIEREGDVNVQGDHVEEIPPTAC